MDPFEARLEFTGLLSRLNASQHSIQKVGNFAMKNRDMYEDLYNCITEELEKTSINARMNILYVLDSISQQSKKAGFTGYIELIQKNLPQIIESIAPVGPKGNVNVAGTKKVLDSWRTKRLYHESAIAKVEKPLLSRELGANAPATSETGLSKDDILRRMDEDRERHKRIREDIWIRAPEEDPAAEFSQQWNEVPDLEEADYEEMVDENDKYLPGYQWEVEFEAVPLPPPPPQSLQQETPLNGAKANGSESYAAGAIGATESPPQSAGPPPPPPLPPQPPRLSPSVLETQSPPAVSNVQTSVEAVIPTDPAVPEASSTSQSTHPMQGQGQGQVPGSGDRPVYINDRKRAYPQHNHSNSSHQQDFVHDRDDYSLNSKRIHPFDHSHHQHLHHRHHHRQTSSGSIASSSTISGTLTPLSASGTPTSSSSSSAAATTATIPATATHTASHLDALPPPRREGYLTTDEREPSRYDRHLGQSRRVEDRFYHHSEHFEPHERSLEERDVARETLTAGASSGLGAAPGSLTTTERRSDLGHGADLDRDRGRDRDRDRDRDYDRDRDSDRGGLYSRSSLSHRDYDRDRDRDRDHYRDHRDLPPHRGRYNPPYHQSHHRPHYQRDAREEHDLRDRTPRDREHDLRDRAPRERDEPPSQSYRHGGD